MFDLWWPELLDAIRDTLSMVAASAAIAALIGIPLAVILVTTAPGGIYERRGVNAVLGALVNVFRSTPFIILLVALLPFTRVLIGTTIGVWAAVVPLSIAAIPFFARIAEVSLREVDRGLIEAALAMGAKRRHIVWHVLLPEALPGMLGGFTMLMGLPSGYNRDFHEDKEILVSLFDLINGAAEIIPALIHSTTG